MNPNLQKVSAKNDFYNYVNHYWLKNNVIPPEYSCWGVFHQIHNENLKLQKNLIENTKNNKLNTLYNQFINISVRSNDELFEIINIVSHQGITESIITMHNLGLGTLFTFYPSQDRKDATKMIGTLGCGKLGLPDRDYYLDKKHSKIFENYKNYIKKILMLWHNDEKLVNQNLDLIIEFEYNLAKLSISKENRRKPELTYNMRNVSELPKIIDWEKYFKRCKSNVKRLNVIHPSFFDNLNLNKKTLNAYFEFSLINHFASYLLPDYDQLKFNFYGNFLNGQKKQKVIWKRAINVVNNFLGEELGKEYVNMYFTKIRKLQVLAMVSHIKVALNDIISNLDWMCDKTKKAAKNKLEKMVPLIGYPDKWKDTSDLNINPNLSLMTNVINASKFWESYSISKIGNLVDLNEWAMTPQTVNAYYSPQKNQIVFPAAILQEPFFAVGTDTKILAKNYGGIGAVIGHEITHGFDDSGRKFDENGNQCNWWTPEDTLRFQEKSKNIVEQYNNCKFFGENLNGELTQGENIADIGGVKSAYKAYHNACRALNKQGQIPDVHEFFLSYAEIWKNLITEAAAKLRVQTDPHSPGIFRVNQVLRNIKEFQEAFNVKPGDGMYLEKIAEVW